MSQPDAHIEGKTGLSLNCDLVYWSDSSWQCQSLILQVGKHVIESPQWYKPIVNQLISIDSSGRVILNNFPRLVGFLDFHSAQFFTNTLYCVSDNQRKLHEIKYPSL